MVDDSTALQDLRHDWSWVKGQDLELLEYEKHEKLGWRLVEGDAFVRWQRIDAEETVL